MLRELVIAVVVAPSLVAAQPGPLPPPGEVVTRDNAALGYWRAFGLMYPRLEEAITEGAELLTMPEFGMLNTSRASIESAGDIVSQLLRSSRLPHCDYGVEYELGYEALLPHISPMRQAVQLLLIDARLRMNAGQEDAAVDRVVAALRIARHAASDRYLISSRVSWTLFELTDDVLRVAFDPRDLSDAACLHIADALAEFDISDPFATAQAMKMEAAVTSRWFRNNTADRSSRRRIIEFLESSDTHDTPETRGIRSRFITSLRLGLRIDHHVDALDTAYARIIEAWREEDPVAELRAVLDRVNKGEFGPLARLTIPAMTRIRADDLAAQARLRDAAARYAAR